jgi:hypothetical protein
MDNKEHLMATRSGRSWRVVLTTSAAAFVVLFPGIAPAVAATGAIAGTTPGGVVTVDVLTVNGSGCPSGTAAVEMSPDNTDFRVTYSSFVARVGVGAAPTDLRKNCQLSVLVRVPQGFTYAIAEATYGGTLRLAAGANGLQRANYYFQGSSDNSYSDHGFAGPYDGPWQATDTLAAAELVYAPCGVSRILNINTEVRVDAGTSDTTRTTSSMDLESTGGGVDTVYHLGWRSC